MGFMITIKEVKISEGAKSIIPLAAIIFRLPGLSKTPAAKRIDVLEDEEIAGYF
jgi:formate--tetrahydrofolate ligase